MSKKLFILSGGFGKEKEVSISSGKNIKETLAECGISCEEVFIDVEKNFIFNGKKITEEEGLSFLSDENALVLQVIHGTYGEDGDLVRKFESKGISFIGSDSKALEKTINKYETEESLRENNISVTNSILVRGAGDFQKLQGVSYPAIVKPNKEGSSIGVVKVNNKGELMDVLEKNLGVFSEVLVQRCIVGREFSCGVMEIDGKEIALTPSEVVLDEGMIFDYHAKYFVNGLEITPAQVDEELKKRIQDVAMKTHKATGCKDYSRTDMMLDENNQLIVLEINTVPGMTKVSFIPAQLQDMGYGIGDFIKGMLKKYS